jgi:hypothetical protein
MSFREMQEEARDIDRRRVQIAIRIAQLQGADEHARQEK